MWRSNDNITKDAIVAYQQIRENSIAGTSGLPLFRVREIINLVLIKELVPKHPQTPYNTNYNGQSLQLQMNQEGEQD
jgi:hypothetical protein